MDLARKKGREVTWFDGVVIASDTLVYRNGKYYGKPASEDDARQMLRELSGQTHSVYTGVYVAVEGKEVVFYHRESVTLSLLR